MFETENDFLKKIVPKVLFVTYISNLHFCLKFGNRHPQAQRTNEGSPDVSLSHGCAYEPPFSTLHFFGGNTHKVKHLFH